MKRQLLTTGLLVAGLAVPLAIAGAPDRNAPYGQFEQSNGYTDTPLAAEDVHEKAVFDDRSNRIGVVKDVLKSARLGPLAIVEIDGVTDTFPKTVAVALDQLILEPDGRLVALLDREDFKALPEFSGQSGVKS